MVRSNSGILQLSEHEWVKAGHERAEQRKIQKDFGLIDAAILVKQKQLGCKIITSDKHFRKLKHVFFLN
jgi:predicted nucleic acid-binding protein